MSAELPEFNEIHDPAESLKPFDSKEWEKSSLWDNIKLLNGQEVMSKLMGYNWIENIRASAIEGGSFSVKFNPKDFLSNFGFSTIKEEDQKWIPSIGQVIKEKASNEVKAIFSFDSVLEEYRQHSEEIFEWTFRFFMLRRDSKHETHKAHTAPQQPRKIDEYFGVGWEQFVRDQIEENGNAELYGEFSEKEAPLHEIEKDVNTIIDEFFGTLEGVAPAPIEIKHGRKEGLGLEPTNFIKITAGHVADDVPGPRIGLYKLEEDDPNN